MAEQGLPGPCGPAPVVELLAEVQYRLREQSSARNCTVPGRVDRRRSRCRHCGEPARRQPSPGALQFFEKKREDAQRAQQDIEAAIKLRPEDAQLRVRRSELAFRQKHFEDAIQHLNQAVTIHPDDPGIRYQRAQLQWSLHHPREACADLRYALCLDPRLLEAYCLLHFIRTTNPPSIEEVFEDPFASEEPLLSCARLMHEVLTTDPTQRIYDLWNGFYGWYEAWLGEPTGMRKQIQTAIAAANEGRHEEAIRSFTSLLESPPVQGDVKVKATRPGLRLNRGIVRSRSGVGGAEAAVADFLAYLQGRPRKIPYDPYTPSGDLHFVTVLPPLAAGPDVPPLPDPVGLQGCGVLEAWRQRLPIEPVEPTLVVVAVSGGGIAAAYWTMSCLTAIEERFPQFPDHVRVVTGASGGMVGAAHYVATLTGRTGPLAHEFPLHTLRDQIAADSLTPVVRRLVLGDVPSIFDPRRQTKGDRGRVLDETFARNTGNVLGRTVGSLRKGKATGWRPSLIISPMIVEDVTPLIISNLDLPYLKGAEFARIFRGADLSLATALRMNAAFPYVTPAVTLPTKPARRVVDAGYLDNYGVGLATAWIGHNSDWLKKHTRHVLLVRIEAYSKPDPNAQPRGWWERINAGLSFASTPLEGLMASRAAVAADRNEDAIKDLMRWFREQTRRDDAFLDLTLTCTQEGQAPLSWYLSRRDRERMDRAIREPAIRDTIELIARYVSGAIDGPPDAGPAAKD